MRPYYYCIMTLLLLTSIALSRPVVLGDGAVGPPEQKDQEQTQNPTASGNPPGPVPGSRSRLLCDGNNNNHVADVDISQYPLYESKTRMKANGFAAFNVAYNIVEMWVLYLPVLEDNWSWRTLSTFPLPKPCHSSPCYLEYISGANIKYSKTVFLILKGNVFTFHSCLICIYYLHLTPTALPVCHQKGLKIEPRDPKGCSLTLIVVFIASRDCEQRAV